MLRRWTLQLLSCGLSSPCASGPVLVSSLPRALHGVALSKNSWLFAGANRGGHRAVAVYSLVPAKLNGVDLRAWLADVLRMIRSPINLNEPHELAWREPSDIRDG